MMSKAMVSDQKGTADDLIILSEEKWLETAVVRCYISLRRGRYWVNIVFYNPVYPFHLKVQAINHYPRQKTAKQYAEIIQREIQKGPHGILKINDHAFNICTN
jgi:hypothetical protein